MLRRGHANGGGDHRVHCDPSAPPEPVQSHKYHTCPTKVTVDVTKYHACDAVWMDVAKCYLYLPHKEMMDVTKFHACHTNGSAGPLWPERATGANPIPEEPYLPHQNDIGCHQIPCLPYKGIIDVTKYHVCHAKGAGDHRVHCGPSAPPEPVQFYKCHVCHVKVMVNIIKYYISNVIWIYISKYCLPYTGIMDISKYHICHAKITMDVTKCHVCYVCGQVVWG